MLKIKNRFLVGATLIATSALLSQACAISATQNVKSSISPLQELTNYSIGGNFTNGGSYYGGNTIVTTSSGTVLVGANRQGRTGVTSTIFSATPNNYSAWTDLGLNGLLDNTFFITAMAIDSQNRVFFATYSQVYNDGGMWMGTTPYNQANWINMPYSPAAGPTGTGRIVTTISTAPNGYVFVGSTTIPYSNANGQGALYSCNSVAPDGSCPNNWKALIPNTYNVTASAVDPATGNAYVVGYDNSNPGSNYLWKLIYSSATKNYTLIGPSSLIGVTGNVNAIAIQKSNFYIGSALMRGVLQTAGFYVVPNKNSTFLPLPVFFTSTTVPLMSNGAAVSNIVVSPTNNFVFVTTYNAGNSPTTQYPGPFGYSSLANGFKGWINIYSPPIASKNVYSLAIDKQGYALVGTDKGLSILPPGTY